jgi:ribosomal protein S1
MSIGNINAIGPAKPSWPDPKLPEEKEFGAESEINKLNLDIKTEQEELSELAKEFKSSVSKGEKDMAQLKSAVMQQKQMSIQAMRMQIKELQEPDAKKAESQTVQAVDQAPPADDTKAIPWGELPVPQEQPAAILELSPYAANLFRDTEH